MKLLARTALKNAVLNELNVNFLRVFQVNVIGFETEVWGKLLLGFLPSFWNVQS